jgi:cobalt-zinc-cadmium efflux system membrane fusion protein
MDKLWNHRVQSVFSHLLLFAFSVLALGGCAHEMPANGSIEPPNRAVIPVPERVVGSVGLKTEPVEIRKLIVPKSLTGRIRPDLGKEIDVSSRVNARVDKLLVQPGDYVKKGQLIAVLTSKEVSDLEARLIEAHARLMTSKTHEERERQAYEQQIRAPKSLLDAKNAVRNADSELRLMQTQAKRQQRRRSMRRRRPAI